MLNKKFVYVLDYFQFNIAVNKNSPWANSLQQNKKAVVKTAAYFKDSNPVRSQ